MRQENRICTSTEEELVPRQSLATLVAGRTVLRALLPVTWMARQRMKQILEKRRWLLDCRLALHDEQCPLGGSVLVFGDASADVAMRVYLSRI